MASVVGHIWAQTVYWNSTSSTKSRIVELAGPRNITAYSTLSSYSFVLPRGFGEARATYFVLRRNRNCLVLRARRRDSDRRFPIDGEFNPPVPYIQANNVIKLKFRPISWRVGG